MPIPDAVLLVGDPSNQISKVASTHFKQCWFLDHFHRGLSNVHTEIDFALTLLRAIDAQKKDHIVDTVIKVMVRHLTSPQIFPVMCVSILVHRKGWGSYVTTMDLFKCVHLKTHLVLPPPSQTC